ncbi:hypothetical protein [Limnobaculum parvum]|uniref:Uncharacterized protein n=1 Tax=Limnobaculum parvum TaxID=2172103 RepID=A0A2Y9U1B8_9GAMM|nr:hypothetical protein [Limnobaculum parvum]AWH89886.1 hypothetical protein HYN51_15900 [Limnobaculum parvum]
MTLFLQNSLTFPVIIFSSLLLIIPFYWICASFGLLDIDILNIDSIDADIDTADISNIAGWMTKLDRVDIPRTISRAGRKRSGLKELK